MFCRIDLESKLPARAGGAGAWAGAAAGGAPLGTAFGPDASRFTIGSSSSGIGIYAEEDLPVFDRMRVLRENLFHHSVELGLDLVHDFHRLDDADDLTFAYSVAHGEVRLCSRLGCAVVGANHRRLHFKVLRLR